MLPCNFPSSCQSRLWRFERPPEPPIPAPTPAVRLAREDDSYTDHLSFQRRLDNSKDTLKDLDNFVDQPVKHLHNCGDELGEDVCLRNLHRTATGCRPERGAGSGGG